MASNIYGAMRSMKTYAGKLTYKSLQMLPTNLRKKAIREARNRNEIIIGEPRRRRQKRRHKSNRKHKEHKKLVEATELELQNILQNCQMLSDIPKDCTPMELLGEIALAKERAITLYVKRDGLDTLKVVLHQPNPTITNLKQAIAKLSRIVLKRACQQVAAGSSPNSNPKYSSMSCSTGELVCSEHRNGHKHRANVSWRFLWRAYALYNVDTKQPINDENGRLTLAELGIENGNTIKFSHRVKYFGRKRQRR